MKRARRGARRPAPLRPGAARLGQDVHRRAADRPPDRPASASASPRTSHKAIHNLLARSRGGARGGRRVPRAEEGRRLRGAGFVTTSGTRRDFASPTTTCCCSPARPGCSRARTWTGVVDTCSSTRRARCRSPTRSRSGRARATSCCSATRSSSPRSRRAIHPTGSRRSVLEHLLGDEETVPPDRGLFLARTLADAPGRLPLHLGDVLRGPAALGAGLRAPADRLARPPGPACACCRSSTTGNRGSSPEEADGSPPSSSGCSAATFTDRDGRRAPLGWTTSSSWRRTTRRCAACASALGRRARDRHGRQVPGPGGAGRLLLDGDLERRGPAAQPRVPLLAQPPQRRGLARAVARRTRREPAAARDPLPHDRADAAWSNALCRFVEQAAKRQAARVRSGNPGRPKPHSACPPMPTQAYGDVFAMGLPPIATCLRCRCRRSLRPGWRRPPQCGAPAGAVGGAAGCATQPHRLVRVRAADEDAERRDHHDATRHEAQPQALPGAPCVATDRAA